MSYAIKAVIEWLFTALVLPIFSFLSVYFHQKKAEAKTTKAIDQFKNAKTKSEIDSAFDNLP